MANSMLSPAQRYAAAALLAFALRHAQLQQEAQPLASSSSSAAEDDDARAEPAAALWTHQSRGLLRPVFRFLEIDSKLWAELEETAISSSPERHIEGFLRTIFDCNGTTSEKSDREVAFAKAVDSMALSLQTDSDPAGGSKTQQQELNNRCDDTGASAANHKISDVTSRFSEIFQMRTMRAMPKGEETAHYLKCLGDEKSLLVDTPENYQRKLTFLFELLSACLADTPQDKKSSPERKGYDARHRVALRLLAKWICVEWIKMEAMEIIIACSAIASLKEEVQSEEGESAESRWSRWKRGGIIGAAALTGGTVLAISGGLAAPAIAAGFSALAPTLGTLVPVIGASGFAAAATAAGSAAGSVAVAASFGAAGAGLAGSKMARRVGDIEEFDFIPIGENHNQGCLAVGIYVSGFVFEEEDFVRPWDATVNNLERYVLRWESKNLIALSNAIQDWITSQVTKELMKRGAMMTVLGTLVTAVSWPTTLLSATKFIDSKWSIAIDRSNKAGKLLAEALLKGLQGNRPVTLIGFSLGARVIFKCLEELSKSGNNEGLVERVFLLGAPISVSGENWEGARKIVAGRFVNVFSTNDWILGITFRASMLTHGLAGIQNVNVPGIENVDVTDIISGHSSYLCAAQEILQQLEA
ncbi:transmembrane and coiled-coil domain-containing protein [Musa troglodytarum]|uniref:Transmembrane and coiled-coil domain-containing protein n=1 Tax=Musa troglodytarum TaxID=320322 RepID=A0A9E7I6D0_9LILI|nr:transmembrane and coiled-coil domain-containing protein [Musa troglodytarum]URE46695.1 transmembrane and coiled-coil domain-containing protein [Musa troglodytarum]